MRNRPNPKYVGVYAYFLKTKRKINLYFDLSVTFILMFYFIPYGMYIKSAKILIGLKTVVDELG